MVMFFVAGVAMVTYYTVHKIDNEEEPSLGPAIMAILSRAT